MGWEPFSTQSCVTATHLSKICCRRRAVRKRAFSRIENRIVYRAQCNSQIFLIRSAYLFNHSDGIKIRFLWACLYQRCPPFCVIWRMNAVIYRIIFLWNIFDAKIQFFFVFFKRVLCIACTLSFFTVSPFLVLMVSMTFVQQINFNGSYIYFYVVEFYTIITVVFLSLIHISEPTRPY